MREPNPKIQMDEQAIFANCQNEGKKRDRAGPLPRNCGWFFWKDTAGETKAVFLLNP